MALYSPLSFFLALFGSVKKMRKENKRREFGEQIEISLVQIRVKTREKGFWMLNSLKNINPMRRGEFIARKGFFSHISLHFFLPIFCNILIKRNSQHMVFKYITHFYATYNFYSTKLGEKKNSNSLFFSLQTMHKIYLSVFFSIFPFRICYEITDLSSSLLREVSILNPK